MIPPIFVQNVYVMYIKISYKFHRIPDTQSRVITKVYDFLGQPSYSSLNHGAVRAAPSADPEGGGGGRGPGPPLENHKLNGFL